MRPRRRPLGAIPGEVLHRRRAWATQQSSNRGKGVSACCSPMMNQLWARDEGTTRYTLARIMALPVPYGIRHARPILNKLYCVRSPRLALPALRCFCCFHTRKAGSHQKQKMLCKTEHCMIPKNTSHKELPCNKDQLAEILAPHPLDGIGRVGFSLYGTESTKSHLLSS